MMLLGLLLRGQVSQPSEEAAVGSVMTDDVVSVPPTATIWDAASTMERRGVKRLPVIDESGDLVGIVSRADIVRAMARSGDELREDVIEAIRVAGAEFVDNVELEGVVGRAI